MHDEVLFRRMAGVAAIVSAPVALTSWVLASLAVDFNFDLMSMPADIITLGPRAAELFHMAWLITDMFGYALLLAPAALYLWAWLKPHSPNLVTLSTLFGFAYIFIAAMTLAILGGAAPPMMRAYAEASGAQQAALLVVFQALIDVAFAGIGALAWLVGGLWWLGIGVVLRQERRVLGIVTALLGGLSLGYAIGMIVRLGPLVTMLETPVLLLLPVWAVWLGVVIWRGAGMGERAPGVVPLVEGGRA